MKTKHLLVAALSAGFLSSVATSEAAVKNYPDAQAVRTGSGGQVLRGELRNRTIGIQGGYANTDDTGYDDTAEFGVEASYQWSDVVSFALEVSGYETEGDAGLADLSRTKLLGKAYAHFRGDNPVVRHSYVGIGAGPVWDEVGDSTDVEAGIAPIVGFDVPVQGESFTLGANANYLAVGGTNPDVFTLNGALKYWY